MLPHKHATLKVIKQGAERQNPASKALSVQRGDGEAKDVLRSTAASVLRTQATPRVGDEEGAL